MSGGVTSRAPERAEPRREMAWRLERLTHEERVARPVLHPADVDGEVIEERPLNRRVGIPFPLRSRAIVVRVCRRAHQIVALHRILHRVRPGRRLVVVTGPVTWPAWPNRRMHLRRVSV